MSETIINLILQLVAGAAGGNAVGGLLPQAKGKSPQTGPRNMIRGPVCMQPATTGTGLPETSENRYNVL